jgi:hypothetical protein
VHHAGPAGLLGFGVTLLADLAGDVGKEPVFALASSMQSGGFAVGAATGSLLMAADSTAAYRPDAVFEG